jgi:hypothetical protein
VPPKIALGCHSVSACLFLESQITLGLTGSPTLGTECSVTNIKVERQKERLRKYSRLKETEEIPQLNVAQDPRLCSGL